jgi:hypothetical protein
LGAEWPGLSGLATREFGPGARPLFRFVIMAMNGAAGGTVLGLIIWPKLKRRWKKYSC